MIALGGGTFVQPANAERLRLAGVQIVFLETPVDLLFDRCLTTVSPEENLRPLAADPEAFAALYESRLPHYRKAHLTVSTDGKTAEQVAQEIASSLAVSRQETLIARSARHSTRNSRVTLSAENLL